MGSTINTAARPSTSMRPSSGLATQDAVELGQLNAYTLQG